MADGQVVFEITGDNRKINDVLRDTTSDIEREGKKWDRAASEAGDSIQDKFTKVFKAVAASAVAAKVGKALLDFGKDAIQAASDLQEVQNVVDVTFGESGAAQIEKWAKAAGQQFGLTETQAKRFTSTLGAMMKSAGLAGPEIVNMSTDLAGLAADMASFYNLDFDTAFQKIRSGISGETEPLKQLGINMSVVNLEAYALTQGITKAFDSMSQGEQTMIRYQYLMQATADAQGDFARTSDGYANAVRTLETNIANLKASVGEILLPIVSEAVGGINDMISVLTTKPKSTVLDDFAAIDLNTEQKLADIQKTADEANALIAVLEDLGDKEIKSTSLTSFVGTLTGKINGLDTAIAKAKNGDYAGTIKEIAEAMAASTGTDAGAWNTLLTAIGDKLPGAVDATLDDKGQTAAFLQAAGDAADSLGGEYPALWAQMLGVLGDDAGAAINALANGATAAAALQGLANGANALKTDVDVDKWKKLLTALSTEGKIDIAAGAGKSIEDLAKALTSNDPGERGQAWSDLLGTLYANIDNLSALTGKDAEGVKDWLDGIAASAANLSPDDATGWSNLLGELRKGLPNLQNASDWRTLLNTLKTTGGVNFDNVTGGIASLAEALESNDPGEKAEAWKTLLGALAADAESLSALTGQDAEGTKEWLQTLAQGVDSIDPNDASAWSNLLSQLLTGLPGLEGMGFEGLFDDLNGEVDDSEKYLRALGYNTDEIADKQAAWLEVCRRLVQTIPGLNEIINTETGEVKGGVQAISDYVEAWRQGQEKMLLWKAYYAKEEALLTAKSEISGTEVEMLGAQNRVKRLREQLEALKKEAGFTPEEEAILGTTYAAEFGEGAIGEASRLMIELADAEEKAQKAEAEHNRQVEANSEAMQELADQKQGLIDKYGEEEEAAEDAAQATEEWSQAQKTAASEAITATTDALKAVEDYYNRIRDDSEKSIQSVVKGFGEIETPAEKARREMQDLTKQIDELNAAGKDSSGLSKTFHEVESSIPSIQNMTMGLKDQLAYLKQYQQDLAAAQAMGVNEDLLATLADGSVESADYLHALATQGNAQNIEALNAAWQEVTDAQNELADSLTETRATADGEFQALVDAAQTAAEDLNQYSTAEGAMEQTVQGIADGIAAKIGTVQAQVDALNAVLSNLGNVGGLVGGLFGGGFRIDGSLATGLDYVPFDNYLAQLHEGESVLNAEEARIWRSFKNGGESIRNNIDYSALSGAIWDNAPKMGGNVYLDGRTVGRVISEQQGNSLRQLERSGWQG